MREPLLDGLHARLERLEREVVVGGRRVQLSDHVPLLGILRRAM